MAKRFYNPGTAIENLLQFDNPTKGDNGEVFPSYYRLKVPAHSFFEVASEIEVPAGDGTSVSVALDVWKRIANDYAKYGVVLIDDKLKTLKSGGNLAKEDKSARELGDRIWEENLFDLVREHQQLCIAARQAGMVPRRAVGPVAHALKTLNIEDPAADVADVVKAKEDNSRVAVLEKELGDLKTLLANLSKAK